MPDAVPAQPGPSWRERQVPPGHAAVWIRIAGAWRPGQIVTWVIEPESRLGWQCQVEPDRADGGRPWSGRYVYDPATIRPRRT